MNLVKLIAIICLGAFAYTSFAQDYYIDTKDKNVKFSFYFKVMDSLLNSNPSDTLFFCVNCVRMMEGETKIHSSGKITYFGSFDFSREDLRKWHEWYDRKYLNGKRITITGRAENAKAGAIVISNVDSAMYYLEGINYWEEKIVGKLVKVSGKLLVKEYKPPPPSEPVKQEIVGIKRTILHPKWELVR